MSLVRKHFADCVHRVNFHNDRIALMRHGQQVAVLVSVYDLDKLQALDDTPERERMLAMQLEVERLKRVEETVGPPPAEPPLARPRIRSL
ncbi:type II toxin-antitoxin system Phd/YefM family antitoxin [Parasulfitobacter algicola]|uniref:Antitoxin n=1 Tax=Parasulfitobacter algicola TaxID=2614809 RepID=A0ABX2IWI1_9RHOB|nr:type II toxin-antitoxin system Phd/YefM family antitoxin [Sulfitobacter algicola]NSX54598.1 type II toxin-antitoxin system Phd/YefM family antitoxin [Sulfitobacter algicola]